MQNFFFFLLLSSFFGLFLGIQSVISSATSEIIREYFVKKPERFDFFISESNNVVFKKIVDEVVTLSSHNDFPFTLTRFNESGKVFEINRSSVLLFDTLTSYQDFHARAIHNGKYPKEVHFLVYIYGYEGENVYDSNAIFRSESFLDHRPPNALRLTTYVIFQQPNCREWNEKEVNRFSSQTKRREWLEYFLEKFYQFNGCELVLAVPYPGQGFVEVYWDSNGVVDEVQGEGIRIFEAIGESLMRFLSYSDHWWLSPPFSTFEEIILISRSKPYTQFEKLFLPFKIEVWTIITLSAAVVTIFILRFTPKYSQQFVFGSRVRTPVMNFM